MDKREKGIQKLEKQLKELVANHGFTLIFHRDGYAITAYESVMGKAIQTYHVNPATGKINATEIVVRGEAEGDLSRYLSDFGRT